jgi:hypothetical protein
LSRIEAQATHLLEAIMISYGPFAQVVTDCTLREAWLASLRAALARNKPDSLANKKICSQTISRHFHVRAYLVFSSDIVASILLVVGIQTKGLNL